MRYEDGRDRCGSGEGAKTRVAQSEDTPEESVDVG